MADDRKPAPNAAVVSLIRSVRAGALATVEDGIPHASLVTPASAPDRSLLVLLSGLSPHTRHLRSTSSCSLLLMAPTSEANPQTAARVSLAAIARPEPDPALKSRWVALHPYAAFYAGLGDFQLWRLELEAAQFIGGFAQAFRLSKAELAPDSSRVASVHNAETRILQHCNDDHADAMDLIAAAHGGLGTGWAMVACDIDGCDLARGDTVVRVAWSTQVDGPACIRAELVRLTTDARVAQNSRLR